MTDLKGTQKESMVVGSTIYWCILIVIAYIGRIATGIHIMRH